MKPSNRVRSEQRGTYLRQRLNQIGKSQRQLSEYMGVSPGRVRKILEGDDLFISELVNICRFCRVTPTDVYMASPELLNDVDPQDTMALVAHTLALPDGAADGVRLLLDSFWKHSHNGEQDGAPSPYLPPVRPVQSCKDS